MSPFNDIIADAAAEAQATIAEIQGMDEGGYNLTGPNGERMVGVFRPANPIEQMDAEKEMTLHGFKDRTVQIVLISRDQFPAIPYAWRRKEITQLKPLVQRCLVAQVEGQDAFFYSFTLLCRQPA